LSDAAERSGADLALQALTRNTTITCILDTARAEPVEARMLSPFDRRRANGGIMSMRIQCIARDTWRPTYETRGNSRGFLQQEMLKVALSALSVMFPEEPLGSVTHRAFPCFENVGERCAGRNMMQKVALHRLIQVSAQRTLVFLHLPILITIYYYICIFKKNTPRHGFGGCRRGCFMPG